uniref:Exocyst complex component EXOC2/Sec5 N-terminal domain-containing protein n=1 Tax=Oryza nivara TaxID=4536 RepID=A0A0E0H0Q8_ORYNI
MRVFAVCPCRTELELEYATAAGKTGQETKRNLNPPSSRQPRSRTRESERQRARARNAPQIQPPFGPPFRAAAPAYRKVENPKLRSEISPPPPPRLSLPLYPLSSLSPHPPRRLVPDPDMASDSDVDEDELLQMALQEQAARDLSHQRPAGAGKPVVNLVRPPANSSRGGGGGGRGGGGPAKARQPSRGGGDDDDDSEVEMLSISSGDEDGAPSSRDRGPPPPRGGGRAGARRAASRDDGDFDDDEPRSWKRVDEAELARRVREMREGGAAPTVDQKAAAAATRKALTNVQTLPRGVEVLDPLGLGVIDNKSLRLITDASVSSPVSREKAQGLDPSMREKVIYSSPNFDPKVFLSWVHKDTSAADLESGALTLKTDLKGRTQQKKQLVKENFDCFVSCKTTIDDIESKLRQIEEDPEGAGTAHLYSVTQKISGAQAEKIRSVQGMLQRFRTLFNLPSAIRGNIRKGEYDLAVREYQKAKSIVLPSHVGILKRVLEEVEKVMQEFRGMLYKSMEDPHLDLAELENIVRLLLELEPETDPVWHYLNIQNSRIHGLFEKCTLDHEARMEVLQNKIREKILSDAKWRQLQQDSNKSLEVDSATGDSFQDDQLSTNIMADEADSLRAAYIRRLTAVLIQHVPAFWRLALSVFSGKFAKAAAGNVLSDSDMNTKQSVNKTDDKGGEAKYTNHTLDEVASMVRATVSAFDTKVQNTFRDFEECNILRPFMGDTIKEIAKACLTLEGKDSSPTAVKMLRALHYEITKLYILRLCSWMRATTKEISKYETWFTLTTLERNKSLYAISSMPLEFRDIIVSAMDRIDFMVLNLRSETAKSYDISQHLHEIHESVRLAFLNSFLDFAGYLERFGGELAQNRSNKENNHTQNGYVNGTNSETSAGMDGDLYKKLLVVLSNIGYCKAELSDELYTKYRHIWSPVRDNDERSADMRDLMTSFSALEEKVLEQYTFAKSNLIRNAARNYLLDYGIHWGAAPAVKGIRDAALDLLHILVAVHAEVYSGARPLLEKAMTILVEGLIDIFLSIFHENKTKELRMLDANGFCQLMLELEYFETILRTYLSTEAEQALRSLQENLLEKACESVTEALENPGHHRRPTRGSEDAASDDRQSVSPDDLLALAQQCSSDLLQGELEKTRLNIACFMESTLQSTPAPAGSKPAAYQSYKAPATHQPVQVSSPSFRRQQTSTNSPAASRRRR